MPSKSQPVPAPLSILRRRDLELRLKLSRSTIYDKINPDSPRYDAAFPKPIRLGAGAAVGWIESEIESWLRRQIEASGDPVLADLLAELQGYPIAAVSSQPATADREFAGVVVPLRLVTDGATLSLFSTTTVFGTPVDVTLSELALECFYPADAATAEALRGLAGQ